MAFEIILKTNLSENNRLNKETTEIMSVSGVLRNQASIVDPVIMVECDLADVTNCNYLTISAFNRHYFVNDIKSIREGLVEFTCHVDVLSTYAYQIRENTGIIKKQETNWNLYLNDGSFKVYQNPEVLTKSFPTGFSTHEFVLAIAGS